MANDVSYFQVEGDSTTYSFDDADLTAALASEISRAKGVEGTLSSLTTTAKGSLVAAINEVDANVDALGTKTYLANQTTNANANAITINSNQSYLENNVIHLAAVITMTGNRAANNPVIGFLTHPPTGRTSYCLFVNTSTGAVTTGSFVPANNGYIYTLAALTSGTQDYIYGTLPLD